MTAIKPKNKATRALELIKAGGATVASLMEALDVDKAGLASQLSYLNTRGLNIAEIDETRAEFPMKNEEGVFYMADLAAYEAKNASRQSGTSALAKPKTPEQIKESAQKREDKASKALSAAQSKLTAAPDDDILSRVVEIRKLELELASVKLHHVEQGNYAYEHATVVEAPDTFLETPKAKKGKNKEVALEIPIDDTGAVNVL